MKPFEEYEARARIACAIKDSSLSAMREEHAKRRALRRRAGTFAFVLVLCAASFLAGFSARGEEIPQEVHTPHVEQTPPSCEPADAKEEAFEELAESSPPAQVSYSMLMENATLTHYCICKKCCGKDESHPAYGITASGRKAEPYYSVAVDPQRIALGTILYLDFGDGQMHEVRADDTGSAITDARLDYCVADHQEALNLGVKTVDVYVAREAGE